MIVKYTPHYDGTYQPSKEEPLAKGVSQLIPRGVQYENKEEVSEE